jgi:putative ABC transport system substrate-binding protein
MSGIHPSGSALAITSVGGRRTAMRRRQCAFIVSRLPLAEPAKGEKQWAIQNLLRSRPGDTVTRMMDDWRVANLITAKTSSAWMVILGLAFGWLALSTTAAETIHRVGVLALGSATGNAADLDALRNRLNDLGYAEGRNLVVEGRYADGNAGRLPALASELVRLNVDAIVTITTPAAQAAKNATDRIPIVMAGSGGPAELGLINSLAHPGGNVTGLTNSPGTDFPAKQLQLLKEAAPKSSRVAVLMTSNSVEALSFNAMQDAAPALGITVVRFLVESSTEIDLPGLAQTYANALYVFPNATNGAHLNAIVAYAAANRLPAVFGDRTSVEARGLMSYWTDWLDLRRRAADFVDKIIRGAKPDEVPVEQPTKFELVVNLKTATSGVAVSGDRFGNVTEA